MVEAEEGAVVVEVAYSGTTLEVSHCATDHPLLAFTNMSFGIGAVQVTEHLAIILIQYTTIKKEMSIWINFLH